MSTCRSCHAPVRWVVTTTGKRMPLDRMPDPQGNVEISDDGTAIVHSSPDGGQPRFLSHFVTCPQASGWRKP